MDVSLQDTSKWNGKSFSAVKYVGHIGPAKTKADKLPYSDESFNIVTCSQSFHRYPYPEQAMREAKRVLKSGGLYILSDTGIGGVGAWIDNHIFAVPTACFGKRTTPIRIRMPSRSF